MAEGWDPYLQPGERLLWEGAPLAGIRNRARLVILSIFGTPFLLVGLGGAGVGLRHLFWLGQAGLGLFTFAFSLAFVGLGYVLVIGQWVEAARAHRTTRYALSDRCAYISLRSHRALHSYPIRPDTALELDHAVGFDNLWFHVHNERDSDGDRTTTRVGFEGIADGTKPYRLLRNIQTGQA